MSVPALDAKQSGNRLYQVGLTRDEMGGSHLSLVHGLNGGQVPRVDAPHAVAIYQAMHRAITGGLVRSCHDLSEGGLAVAAAEMAFAGGLGMKLNADHCPVEDDNCGPHQRLFSESNTRFLCEVSAARADEFEEAMAGLPVRQIGELVDPPEFLIECGGQAVVSVKLTDLKEAWQAPLRW